MLILAPWRIILAPFSVSSSKWPVEVTRVGIRKDTLTRWNRLCKIQGNNILNFLVCLLFPPILFTNHIVIKYIHTIYFYTFLRFSILFSPPLYELFYLIVHQNDLSISTIIDLSLAFLSHCLLFPLFSLLTCGTQPEPSLYLWLCRYV